MSNESVQVYYPSDEIVKNAAVSGMDAYKALCAEAEADYNDKRARIEAAKREEQRKLEAIIRRPGQETVNPQIVGKSAL